MPARAPPGGDRSAPPVPRRRDASRLPRRRRIVRRAEGVDALGIDSFGAMLGRVKPDADETGPAAWTAAPVAVPVQPSAEVPAGAPRSAPAAVTLDEFLAGIGARAFRFAEIGLRQREDALDAVQDAMIKMLSYAQRPAEEWTPLFWSILRSRIVDIQRRRTFRLRWMQPPPEREPGSVVEWADEGPDPVRAHDSREAYATLVEALAALPRRQREAFSLRILQDLDGATTARVMGCSEGAVKTHLSRAREALQRQLEDWR